VLYVALPSTGWAYPDPHLSQCNIETDATLLLHSGWLTMKPFIYLHHLAQSTLQTIKLCYPLVLTTPLLNSILILILICSSRLDSPPSYLLVLFPHLISNLYLFLYTLSLSPSLSLYLAPFLSLSLSLFLSPSLSFYLCPFLSLYLSPFLSATIRLLANVASEGPLAILIQAAAPLQKELNRRYLSSPIHHHCALISSSGLCVALTSTIMIPLHHLLRKCPLFLLLRKPDSIFPYIFPPSPLFFIPCFSLVSHSHLYSSLLPSAVLPFIFSSISLAFLPSPLSPINGTNNSYSSVCHHYLLLHCTSDTASRPGGGGGSALHPAITATASVALWNVLHNSEQARALARGAVQDQYQHQEGGLVQMLRMCETRPYSDVESMKRREDETSALHLNTKGYPYERQRGTLALADSTHRARLAVLSLMESEGTRC
jgi:hypothetical protein